MRVALETVLISETSPGTRERVSSQRALRFLALSRQPLGQARRPDPGRSLWLP